MLNTGLLLKKPEESSYARFCRILIANQTLHSNKHKFRKKLINLIRDKSRDEFSIDINVTNLELAAEFERIFINHNSINSPIADVDANYRKKIEMRNCTECAQIGYHSDLFNLPWIKLCPIHQIKLSKYCQACNQPWSVPSELYSNTCQECGVKVDPTLLINRKGFLTKQRYRDLIRLRKVLNKYAKSKQTFHFIDENNKELLDKPINSETDFMPTIISLEQNLTEDEKNKLKKFGVSFYKYLRVKFYCPNVRTINTRTSKNNKIKEKIHRNNYFKMYWILATKAGSNHRIGQCIKNNSDDDNACIECKTWSVFRDLIIETDYNLFLNNSSNTFYKSNRLYCELSEYYKSNNQIQLPKLVTFLTVSNIKKNQAIRTLKIPRNIQALIYSIDLWSLFFHLYQSFIKIDKLNDFYSNNKSGPLVHNYRIDLLGCENTYNCPFYMSEKNNIAYLTVPKSLIKYNLAYSSDLNKLLFYSKINVSVM